MPVQKKETSSDSKSDDSDDSNDSDGSDNINDSESDKEKEDDKGVRHEEEQMQGIISNKENNNLSDQKTEIPPEESIGETGRLFVRNLPYICTEDDLRKEFVTFGPLAEVNINFI
jgi:multiple RNA-binding domain-containing protein 1